MEAEIEKAFRYYCDIAMDDEENAENDEELMKKLNENVIDLKKLKKVADALADKEGGKASEDDLMKMIKTADSDNDGFVSLDDFKKVMRRMKLF
jgi:Ca2+-binding EF-hand superfamily protein